MEQTTISINDKRLLSVKDLCTYISRGRNQAMAWGREIGAERRFTGNRRVFYDRYVIDRELDKMAAQYQRGE